MADSEYQNVALNVRELHILRDPELVAESAAHHGLSVAKLFEPMEWGKYNVRLPEGDDYERSRIAGIRGIAKLCIDYRQGAEVASLAERDGLVAWADAGGAAQPDKGILRVDINYWEALLAVNPDLIAYLFVHLEVCGGANYYSNTHMRKLRETKIFGAKLERDAMRGYLHNYEKELRRLKSNFDIKLGIVNIANDKFRNVDFI